MTTSPVAPSAAVAARRAEDRRLVEGCRRGDADAWARLVTRYERLVFAIPLRHGLSRDDAADVAQSTFAALLDGLEGLREADRVGAWLCTVARRTAWRLAERRRRERTDPVEGSALDGVVDPVDDPTDRWDRVEWLLAGLDGLEPRCRDLLHALYLDPAEPSYAEVAARLGRPIGSIGPTRARCLERLRDVLDDAG